MGSDVFFGGSDKFVETGMVDLGVGDGLERHIKFVGDVEDCGGGGIGEAGVESP